MPRRRTSGKTFEQQPPLEGDISYYADSLEVAIPMPPIMEVPQKYNRPRRTEELQNNTVTSRGGATLQIPDRDVLQEIQDSEPRVRYFGVGDTEEFLSSGTRGIGEPEFYRLFMHPLAWQVAHEFPGQSIAMRGIKTSINGAVEVDECMTVLDIQDVVNAGEERLQGCFRCGGFNPDDDAFPIHYRVAQYASDTELFREEIEDGSGRSEGIFPAILVYDFNRLTRKGGHYATTFSDPDKADEAILAAYVLDCPVSR